MKATENRAGGTLFSTSFAALLLFLVTMAGGCLQRIDGVTGLYHDDGIYVTTAKSLAEGRGYRLINLPDEPPQTKYPILFPAILALIWAIWPVFPENLLLMQGFTIVCGSAAVALCYAYLVRFQYASPAVAFAACLVCATASTFLHLSSMVLAEMPFAAVLIVALWRLERLLSTPEETRSASFLTGFLLGIPFLVRTLGFVLLPAALLSLRHKGRQAVWVVAGYMSAALPWIGWAALGASSGDPEGTSLYYTDYLGWWSESGVSIFHVVMANGLWILSSIATLSFEGLFWVLGEALRIREAPLIGILPGALSIVVLASRLKRPRPLELFLLLYLCVVLVWPWFPDRFLVPVIPMLLAYMLRGVSELARSRIGASASYYIATLFLSSVLLTNLSLAWSLSPVIQRSRTESLVVPKYALDWESYRRVFAWIRENPDRSETIACVLDPMTYLYTEHKAFMFLADRLPLMVFNQPAHKEVLLKQLVSELEAGNTRYLLVHPFASWQRPLIALLDEFFVRYEKQITLIYEDADPRFRLYRLHLDPTSDSFAASPERDQMRSLATIDLESN